MATRYFKDFYGCTASIKENAGCYWLRVSNAHGRRIKNAAYETYRGARSAMGRMGDCWKEVTA